MTKIMTEALRGKTIAEAVFGGEGFDQTFEIRFEDGSTLYVGLENQTLGVGAYAPEELDEDDGSTVNMRFGFSFRLYHSE